MLNKKEWDKRYDENALPWDSGQPDPRLMKLLSSWPECRGRVLDIGCGTGTNAVWLAEQGFQVTALDISTSAVAMARRHSVKQGVECTFFAADFLSCSLGEEPFSLIFDRGCFHSMGGRENRQSFVSRAASCLGQGGLWFSLIGNKDQAPTEGNQGPPRLSAAEICADVEPAFEILHLESSLGYSVNQSVPLRLWQCLMRLRRCS